MATDNIIDSLHVQLDLPVLFLQHDVLESTSIGPSLIPVALVAHSSCRLNSILVTIMLFLLVQKSARICCFGIKMTVDHARYMWMVFGSEVTKQVP